MSYNIVKINFTHSVSYDRIYLCEISAISNAERQVMTCRSSVDEQAIKQQEGQDSELFLTHGAF